MFFIFISTSASASDIVLPEGEYFERPDSRVCKLYLNDEFICTAEWLHDQTFSTAAHCIDLWSSEEKNTYSLRCLDQEYALEKSALIHSLHTENDASTDIGFIYTQNYTPFTSPYVIPETLEDVLSFSDAFTCYISGAGQYGVRNSKRILPEEFFPVGEVHTAKLHIDAQVRKLAIHNNHLEIPENKNLPGVLPGDSGGALTCKRDGKDFLLGIIHGTPDDTFIHLYPTYQKNMDVSLFKQLSH